MPPNGWSQMDLAAALAKRRALGVSEPTKWRSRLANYETDRPSASADALKEIAETMQISLSWFLDNDENSPILWYRQPNPVGLPDIRDADVEFDDEVEMTFAGYVPCSGVWGEPLLATGKRRVPRKWRAANRYTAEVVGDSCYPALRENDLTCWEYNKNPPVGSIVLAERSSDHACTVKELAYEPGTYRPNLRPINPTSEPPPNDDGWEVVAWLVGVKREKDGLEQDWFAPRTGIRRRHLMPDL